MFKNIDIEDIITLAIGAIIIFSIMSMIIWASFRTDTQLKEFEQQLNQTIVVEQLTMRMK